MALRKKFCLKLPAIFADEYRNAPASNYRSWHGGNYKAEKEPTLAAAAHKEFGENGYDILVIDLFYGGEMVGRYFADKVTDEHKGWDVKSGKWYQKIRLDNLAAGILSLPMDNSYWGWQTDHYSFRTGDDDTVHDYFGKEISSWENSAESSLVFKRANRHEELVRQRVASWYEDPDAEFREWARKLATPAVLTERKKDKKVTCTCSCCGATWQREKFYRSGHWVECPECGEKVKPARLGPEKEHFATEQRVYRVAPGKDGVSWFLEMTSAYGYFFDDKREWEVHADPDLVVRLKRRDHYGQCFYLFNAGWSDRKHGFNIMFRKGYLYKDFKGAEKLMDEGQARRLRAIADTEFYCNVDRAVMMKGYSYLEYLIKGGYRKLSGQIVDGCQVWREEDEPASAEEFFGFNRWRQNRLRQMDGGIRAVEWLRWEERTGKKISDEDLKWFADKNVSPSGSYMDGWTEMLQRIGSPRKVRNYVEKQSAASGKTVNATAWDYADYIRMAKDLRFNLSHEMFYKPKNLKAAHDECVRIFHEQEWEIKAKGTEEQFPEVNGILESIIDKYEYIGDEYRTVVPKGIVDILKEGAALGHCVDTSNRYFERIEQRTTYIVFLRKNDYPEQPYYTLEIQPSGTVRQQRTTGNVKDEEQVKAYRPFILEWQKEVRKRLTAEDRKLDKESDRIRIEEYKDLRERKELIHRGMLAGTLLVDALESDLIVSAV